MDNQPLRSTYTIWVYESTPIVEKTEKEEKQAFDQNLKPILTISTIREFWEAFQYMKKPSEMVADSDIYIFKEGVKPLWEDQANKNGGYFNVRIEKKKSNKIWENLMLLTVCPMKDNGSWINGIRLKIKEENDTMQIWVCFGDSERDKLEAMKTYLKDNLQITDDKAFKYLSISYHLKNLSSKNDKPTFYPKK